MQLQAAFQLYFASSLSQGYVALHYSLLLIQTLFRQLGQYAIPRDTVPELASVVHAAGAKAEPEALDGPFWTRSPL
jgi:hypothetical protein